MTKMKRAHSKQMEDLYCNRRLSETCVTLPWHRDGWFPVCWWCRMVRVWPSSSHPCVVCRCIQMTTLTRCAPHHLWTRKSHLVSCRLATGSNSVGWPHPRRGRRFWRSRLAQSLARSDGQEAILSVREAINSYITIMCRCYLGLSPLSQRELNSENLNYQPIYPISFTAI